MTPEWLEQNAKIAEAEGFLELAEGFRERKRNWHTWVTGNWSEVGWSHHSVQETADKLTASYIEQRGTMPRHVLRKLTLDLLCASFPKGHPPPAALVRLMKCALELPESHEVGSWPIIAGEHDDRGEPDHEMRFMARRIDQSHRHMHDEIMSLSALARHVEKALHRKCDRKSLRRWRDKAGYWDAPQDRGK